MQTSGTLPNISHGYKNHNKIRALHWQHIQSGPNVYREEKIWNEKQEMKKEGICKTDGGNSYSMVYIQKIRRERWAMGGIYKERQRMLASI